MTALVDVLAHPDLSLVSSLGLADNGLCDEWWGRGLGSRLGSPACASLRDLDLRGNALSGAAAVELAPLLKDELAMLNKVGGGHWCNKGVQEGWRRASPGGGFRREGGRWVGGLATKRPGTS